MIAKAVGATNVGVSSVVSTIRLSWSRVAGRFLTLAPLFPAGKEKERVHSARVLWSALHGICSLEGGRKLAKHESVEALSESLVAFYVEGLTGAVRKGRYA